LRPKTGATLITLQTRLESISEALKVVLDQVDDLRAHPVSPGELAAIKRYYAGRLPRDLESNQDLADEVSEMTFYRLGDDYLDHFLARIQAVTSADVQRVARRYFAPEHRIVSVVGPETVKPAIIPYGPLRELTRAELIR